jgi:hypothetical protein
MIVTKVMKHSKRNQVIATQPSAEIETTTLGIHVPKNDISVCAFQIYQERGSQPGYEIEDWLKAERQITQR